MTLMTLEPEGRGVGNRRLTLRDPIVYLNDIYYNIGFREILIVKLYPPYFLY